MDKIYHIGKGKGKETLFLSGRCFTSASVPAKQIRITEKNLNWLKTHVHRHDSPEFFLVVSGRFNFMLDGKLFHLRRGDLVLINSLEVHTDSHLPDKRLSVCWGIIWLEMIIFLHWHNNRVMSHEMLKTGSLNPLILDIWKNLQGPSEVKAKQELLGLLPALSSYFLRKGKLLWNFSPEPKRIIEQIDEYVDQLDRLNISLDSLARTAGYSRVHFQRLFRKYSGMTFREYILKKRVERYRRLLTNNIANTKELAYKLGFSSVKALAFWAKSLLAKGIRING